MMDSNLNQFTEKKVKPTSYFVIMVLSSAMYFMLLLITPALPELSTFFSKSDNYTKQIVTWYMMGLIPGVLFYAPFSNRFGRKKALYLGLSIASLGTILGLITYFYKSFLVINIGRFFQGLGIISTLQVAITLISECYEGKKAKVISAYSMLSSGLCVGLGVVVGAFLCNLGWIFVYLFMTLYLIFLFVLVKFFVYETLSNPNRESLKEVCIDYLDNIKIPQIILAGLLSGTAGSISYIFPSIASFIVLDTLKYSQNVFALWNIMPPIGIVLGCYFSSLLVHTIKPLYQMYIGAAFITIAAVSYYIFFKSNLLTLSTVFFPYTVGLLGTGFVAANALVFTVVYAKNKSTSSSSFTVFAYGSSTTFMFALSYIKSTSIFVVPIFFSVAAIICWTFSIILRFIQKNPTSSSSS